MTAAAVHFSKHRKHDPLYCISRLGLEHSFLLCPCTGALCSVCKDDFSVGEKLLKLPCQHLYHKDCVIPWLELVSLSGGEECHLGDSLTHLFSLSVTCSMTHVLHVDFTSTRASMKTIEPVPS